MWLLAIVFVGRTLVRQLLPAINPMGCKTPIASIIFSIGIHAKMVKFHLT
jgi:hypothetical protein